MPDRGRYYRQHRVALIRAGATTAEWAGWAVHEAIHHLRDDGRCADDWWEAKQEAVVDQTAAHLLIPLDALTDALRWAHNLAELADELWVDEATVRTRLDHLHPSERAWLRRQLDLEGEA